MLAVITKPGWSEFFYWVAIVAAGLAILSAITHVVKVEFGVFLAVIGGCIAAGLLCA